jgi:hypothetical protein
MRSYSDYEIKPHDCILEKFFYLGILRTLQNREHEN